MCVPFCAFNHFTFSRVCAFFHASSARGQKKNSFTFIFLYLFYAFMSFFFSSFSILQVDRKIVFDKMSNKVLCQFKGFHKLNGDGSLVEWR